MTLEKEAADAVIERYSRHLERAPGGYSSYGFWLSSEEEARPGITAAVMGAARGALASASGPFLQSAIQALACCGDASDITALRRVQASHDTAVAAEASAAIEHIQYRMKTLESLLSEVNSRESFIAFVAALAKEREAAETLERANPQRYGIDGALDWKNARISAFLYAALARFDEPGEDARPSWQTFADFLYHGKIIE